MSGFIYTVRSAYFTDDIYKIGMSTRNKNDTIKRYKTPYGRVDIKVYKYNKNPCLTETIVHKILDKFRLDTSELFQCNSAIIELISLTVCNHVNNDIIQTNEHIKIYNNLIAYFNDNDEYNIDSIREIIANIDDNEHNIDKIISNINDDEIIKVNKVQYTCEKCGKSFNHYGNYTRHVNRKTPCNEKGIFQCQRCKKLFSYKSRYTKHVNRKFPCKSMKDILHENEVLKLQNKILELSKN